MVPLEDAHDFVEELRLLEALWLPDLDATDGQYLTGTGLDKH